jgi:tetratricopeptide (TPR) repeat protein
VGGTATGGDVDETSPSGRKGEILRPKGFHGSASAPLSFASSAVGGPSPALLPPDAAEALYYEGMAAYQHRNWRDALERFTRLKELQPTRPGLDALIQEVRWFLQLEAAAPVGRELAEGSPRRRMGRADLPRLSRGHRILLIALAFLAVASTLLVAFQSRLPWGWLPWRVGGGQEAEQLYNEGQERLAVGDYEGAEAAFQKILEMAPGNTEAQRGINSAQRQQLLAQGYAAAGAAIAEEDWQRAAIELANVLAVDPNYADARARAGFVAQRQRLQSLYEDGARLYDLGQWQEALGQFEKVRRLDPGYRAEAVNEFLFVSYINAANALLETRGDDLSAVEQAVGYHEKALGIHPRNRIAGDAYRLGRLYLASAQAVAQGDLARARAQLVALLAEAPDYANGAAMRQLYNITVNEGREALAAGDIPAALERFDRALALGVQDTSDASAGKQLALAVTPTPTPTATNAPPPTPEPTPWAIVPAGPIGVRSGPDRTYPVVGQLEQGAQVVVTGRRPDGLWVKVCCVAGEEVWVAVPSLTVNGALALAPEVIPPTPTARPIATPAPTRVRPTATPQLYACVSGHVYTTAGGTGLVGWAVTVQEPGGLVRATRTNRSGFYRFSELPSGSYLVAIESQPGWRLVSPQSAPADVRMTEVCSTVDFWNEPEGEGPPPTPVR